MNASSQDYVPQSGRTFAAASFIVYKLGATLQECKISHLFEVATFSEHQQEL